MSINAPAQSDGFHEKRQGRRHSRSIRERREWDWRSGTGISDKHAVPPSSVARNMRVVGQCIDNHPEHTDRLRRAVVWHQNNMAGPFAADFMDEFGKCRRA